MVGHSVDLTYSYDHLGEETSVLTQLANGTHPFCQVSAPSPTVRSILSAVTHVWSTGPRRRQASRRGRGQQRLAEGGRRGHPERRLHHRSERQDQQRGGGWLEGSKRPAQVPLGSTLTV